MFETASTSFSAYSTKTPALHLIDTTVLCDVVIHKLSAELQPLRCVTLYLMLFHANTVHFMSLTRKVRRPICRKGTVYPRTSFTCLIALMEPKIWPSLSFPYYLGQLKCTRYRLALQMATGSRSALLFTRSRLELLETQHWHWNFARGCRYTVSIQVGLIDPYRSTILCGCSQRARNN
jgi:hypothetical protein